MCVTQVPHDQSVVFINGVDCSNSWLDLKQEHLPDLKYNDIRREIERVALPLSKKGKIELADALRNATRPYAMLEFIAEKII